MRYKPTRSSFAFEYRCTYLFFIFLFIASSLKAQHVQDEHYSDLREREHILSVELLGMLIDTGYNLPIACTADEMNKMIRQEYSIQKNDINEILSLLESLKSKLQNGEISKDSLLRELLTCHKFSGKIINYFSGCYIVGMSSYFKGIVFFNLGRAKLENTFWGDATHTFRNIENEPTLNIILHELRTTNQQLVIEARSSLPGNESLNDSLSDRRSRAVKEWFLHMGIDKRRIKTLYLGEAGPYITERVCETYSIKQLFEDYYEYAPSHIDFNGNVVMDGLNQSVALYLLPPDKATFK
jgi:hypothetical protein